MSAEPELPSLEIGRVEYSPEGEQLLVRLHGRWRARRRRPDDTAILMVEADGRSYRFPAIAQPLRARLGKSAAWSGSFALPSWLEPRLAAGLTVTVGEVKTRIPGEAIVPGAGAPGRGDRPDEAEAHGSGTTPAQGAPTVPAPDQPADEHSDAAAETRDQASAWDQPSARDRASARDQAESTIAALGAELEARTASESRLRGRLTETQAQLLAQATDRAQVEAAQAELRREFDQLRALVEREGSQRVDVESRAAVLAARVAEIEEQVAELTASRDAAVAECDQLARELTDARAELAVSAVAREAASIEALGLRSELERLGGQLATARDDAARNREQSEAESLLAEARALTASLRRRAPGPPTPTGGSPPDSSPPDS